MNQSSNSHSFGALLVSLCAVSLIMLYFIWLSPPMADNFIFSREITPGFAEFYSGSNISMAPLTLASAWRQAFEMYFTWCGRFTGNLAVFLLFLLPRPLYALVVACLYGFYLIVLLMCIFGRAWKEKISPGWIFGLAALLWVSLPSYGEAFFWLSVGGQIALLGQALILLPFRLALDSPLKYQGPLANMLAAAGLGVSGIAVAMLDYPTSAALPPTALACVVGLWLRDRAFPWLLAICAAGLCLGALATLAAPGNACRLALSTDTSVSAYIAASWPERISSWLLHLPGAVIMHFTPLLFLLCACICLARANTGHWYANIPVPAWLFFLPACLTWCAYLLTAWPPPRAFATCSVQLLICACIIFASARPSGPAHLFRFLRALLCIYCVCTLVYEANQFWILNKEYRERTKLLINAVETAEIPPFSVKPDKYQPLGDNLADISPNPDFWVNRAIARFHGLKSVKLFRPEMLEGSFIYQQKPGATSALAIEASKGRLRLSMPQTEDIHIYYYGAPGLLSLLPFGLDKTILARIIEAREGDWQLQFVPLLMARLDLPAGETESEQLKLASAQKIWLVEPGKSWWSTSLIPLANSLPKAYKNSLEECSGKEPPQEHIDR